MSFQVGDTIGDYQVIGVLGAGGMGQVYKVRNVISERVEAMKVLLPDLVSDPELADRFLREIKVQASLDHPNIAKLHTALRAGNQLIMIMELVEGATLGQMQEQGPVPLSDGLRYISDSLDALSYAHEHGVIHRDIKPANIMLTRDGVIKLMDFGIAKAAADRSKLTMTGATMGSLYYMSPEQVKGVAGLDPRSDLYSLGVTLYEVVTGQRPFQGDSDYAIMSAHLEKLPRPPLEMDPSLPAALNEIILRALAKSPDERFQSAAAFRKALESVRGPEVTRVAPRRAAPRIEPAAPEPFVRPAKPHRGLYVLAGATLTIVILLAAGIQVANWRKTRAGGAPQVEPPPPVVQEPAQAPVPPPPAPTGARGRLGRGGDWGEAATPQPAPVVQKPAVPQTPAPAAQRATPPPPQDHVLPRIPDPRPVAPSPPPPLAPSPPRPLAPSPQDSAASGELRDRMVFLAARAATVRNGLANLERQQARMGLGLRPDMAAANQRLDFLLKEAGAALASGDSGAAKRNADMAEREVEKLEKFLGK